MVSLSGNVPIKFICSICEDFETFLYRNIILLFISLSMVLVICIVSNCSHSFRNMRSYLRNLKWAHNEFYAMHYQNISMNSNPENDLNTEKIVDAIVQDQNETVSTEENQNITVPPGTVPLSPRNDKLALPENIPYEDYVYHFLLELREKYKVSGVACEFVAQKMKKLHDINNCEIKTKFVNILKSIPSDLVDTNVSSLESGASDVFSKI